MRLKQKEPHPHQDQRQAFKQMVDRFARIGFGRAQPLIETGPDRYPELRRILIEIDETMLPRRIVFENGRRRQIELHASNRRLLAVKAKGFEPETAPNSPQKLAQQFAELLQSFVAESETICLRPPQKIAPLKDAGVSVSTDLLARALGLIERWNDADPVDVLEVLKETSIASLHATPCLSFSCEQGPETEVGRLKSFWREYTRNVVPKTDTWRGPDGKRECRAFELDRQKYLVVVQTNHVSAVLAVLPRKHLNTLAMV
ncbi:MAG: hypothetical protein AAF280_00310 [Pseudomonadota bacterium]